MPAALVAAYLLVLQSTLGAFAFGLSPVASQLDAFGNIICTHDGAAELPGGDPHQQHMPACCMLGCNMVSPVPSSPPDAVALARSLVFEAVAFVFPATTHLDFARERSPSNPRAPPLTV
ncbi:hypothetical protein OHD62_12600 [Mesorhizobium sp. YC-39]|uniref:DUF2946 family protein n=1 Tax=unclassified Mesorhizobium TaxID=325217 RepID=UPI0021E8D591|nr:MULTISPECIES: DUF2946 family protein [unclassified Mesorhizobium]MCV3207482.1 hypothetical protein [Mesorhizobium sp. YC-2]MCV3229209.1 hypothetical protein [Mesorhizobium sp. YC-39]